MLTRKVTVGLENGLEARAIAVLVQMACRYNGNVFIEYNGKKVNAKSIMGIMSLGVAFGEEVTLSAEGTEEEEAVKDLEAYLKSGKE